MVTGSAQRLQDVTLAGVVAHVRGEGGGGGGGWGRGWPFFRLIADRKAVSPLTGGRA